MTTQGERLVAVEVRLGDLEKKVDEMSDDIKELLALRYKGAGAFWLASTLIGTGIIGAIVQLLNWFKGH